jgi:hypothetical protein
MDSFRPRLPIILNERASTERCMLGLPGGTVLRILALGSEKNLPFVEGPGPP